MNRWVHTGLAFGVGLAVSLRCIVFGALLARTFETHPIVWVGAFLHIYAWVIGILGGLWYLLKGPTMPPEENGGDRR